MSRETRSRQRAHCATMRIASRTIDACVNHSKKVCKDTRSRALPYHRTLERRSAQFLLNELGLDDKTSGRVADEGEWITRNERDRRHRRRSNDPYITRIDDVRFCDPVLEVAAWSHHADLIIEAYVLEPAEQTIAVRRQSYVALPVPWK